VYPLKQPFQIFDLAFYVLDLGKLAPLHSASGSRLFAQARAAHIALLAAVSRQRLTAIAAAALALHAGSPALGLGSPHPTLFK
jgi:hypothetical protein